MSEHQRIIAAACELDGLIYTMPPPARHHDIVYKMPEGAARLACEQGFLTSTGRFLDRTVARYMAIDMKQVKDMSVLHPRHLFSEDLW